MTTVGTVGAEDVTWPRMLAIPRGDSACIPYTDILAEVVPTMLP